MDEHHIIESAIVVFRCDPMALFSLWKCWVKDCHLDVVDLVLTISNLELTFVDDLDAVEGQQRHKKEGQNNEYPLEEIQLE